MFAFTLFSFIISIDENIFGPDCLCATTPGQCTPYCSCDPYCTDIQKGSFDFLLPEKTTDNDIACDNENRIKWFHSKSVSRFTISNNEKQITCYYYESGKANDQKVISYPPEDFGLSSYADAITHEEFLQVVEEAPIDAFSLPRVGPDTTGGYLRGKPIKINNGVILNVTGDENMPLLFGVDTSFSFTYQMTNQDELNNTFDLSKKGILFDSIELLSNIVYSFDCKIDNSLNYIEAYWTFFFQKRGTNSNFHYIIRKIKSEYLGPLSQSNFTANVHARYIEISDDGSAFEPKTEKLFSYSLTNLFKSLFTIEEDSSKTAGIIFSIGLLWTIWTYYTFYFSDV